MFVVASAFACLCVVAFVVVVACPFAVAFAVALGFVNAFVIAFAVAFVFARVVAFDVVCRVVDVAVFRNSCCCAFPRAYTCVCVCVRVCVTCLSASRNTTKFTNMVAALA